MNIGKLVKRSFGGGACGQMCLVNVSASTYTVLCRCLMAPTAEGAVGSLVDKATSPVGMSQPLALAFLMPAPWVPDNVTLTV